MRDDADAQVDRYWDGISSADIDRALTHIQEQIAKWGQEVGQLEQRLVAAHRESHLLEQILAVRRGESVSEAPSESPAASGAQAARPPSAHPAVEEAVKQIRDAKRALHISELYEAVSRTTHIPGAGKQANLISHLSRDQRIARPARGLYGLKELGHTDGPAKRKTGRRSKSHKSSRTRQRTKG